MCFQHHTSIDIAFYQFLSHRRYRGCSSVVERSLCMWKARGSIPRISNFCPVSNRAVVAEWLRRWTWNPMGSARVGSNPANCEILFPARARIMRLFTQRQVWRKGGIHEVERIGAATIRRVRAGQRPEHQRHLYQCNRGRFLFWKLNIARKIAW